MINAVIFDMDGVISDTQELHATIESEILSRYGVKIGPDEITRRYAGSETRIFFRELLPDMDEEKIEELMQEKWQRIDKVISGSLKAMPGAIELIKELKAKGMRIGLASGSVREYIDRVVDILGVKDSFDAISSAEEVERGKPSPDVFILAAKRIRVEPGACVVIEDGVNGMLAAREAGMKCIALADDANGDYPADLVTDSLKKMNYDIIKNI